jgi:hypothetical protein
MDSSFIPVQVVPSKTPFGLDQLRRSYKTALSAEDAIAAAPAVGDADEVFANMFLMPISTPESAESATRIDLVYTGSLSGDEGDPDLPAIKHSLSDAIASATTYTSSAIFPAVATVPASVSYHAHTSVITLFSIADTSAEVCPDPAAVTVDDLVSWTLAAEQPASSFPDIAAWLLSAAFVQRVIETINSDEIVPGQYWQITKRKVTQLYPYAPPPP